MLLERAFANDPPAGPLPPGPRTNDWTRSGAAAREIASAEATLLDALWGSHGPHLRADGTPTSVSRRLVPSAGGAYPVQWHVVVPDGVRSTLPPGRYAREASGNLMRRPGPPPSGRRVTIALTVQPGRTFGRYRHRSWPLWVADAAYALEALRLLVPATRLPQRWADLRSTRDLLAVPRAADAAWWLARGLAPEVCLAHAELPDGWRTDARALALLRPRRSPALAAFAARRSERRPARAVRTVAELSGQGWVLGADDVVAWQLPDQPATPEAYAPLWQAHREAAQTCYRLAARGVGVRPVSGFTRLPGRSDRPLLHALALLAPKEDH